MKTNIKRIDCKRCGHTWYARLPEVRICPRCKSPYFDTERVEKCQ